jgi:leader peptidase (prepilin peptidase)/N-methyltransferase
MATVLAVVFAVLAVRTRPLSALPADAVLVSGLVVLGAVDLACQRLPRRLIVRTASSSVTLMGLSAVTSGRAMHLVGALAAAGAAMAALWVVHRCTNRPGGGLGRGDVRLAALVGLGAGWSGPPGEALLLAAVALLVACGSGMTIGLLRVAAGAPAGRRFAFGPHLAGATLAVVLFGPAALAALGLR